MENQPFLWYLPFEPFYESLKNRLEPCLEALHNPHLLKAFIRSFMTTEFRLIENLSRETPSKMTTCLFLMEHFKDSGNPKISHNCRGEIDIPSTKLT